MVWLSEPFLRLRVEVSAPECTFDGPNSKTFRLFPQADSPVFRFNLTPKVVGTINIVVNLYQEEDTLGSAGTNTLITEQPVGDVTLKLESAPSPPSRPHPVRWPVSWRGAWRLAGALAHIYFDQASIRRIVIDSGLDPSHIAFDNRADNSWSDVLRSGAARPGRSDHHHRQQGVSDGRRPADGHFGLPSGHRMMGRAPSTPPEKR
ncbi:MAG: hypothetical protein HZY76_02660 [Anaerolineae bacterium]|nr:MAG: hypothetical protein HZY76_02660 [Anaerolineae bacterium]